MSRKLVLTSLIAIGFAYPAIATPTNTGTFPSNGLMLEDYTYTNAATSTNMDGVYEGFVVAKAQYANVTYDIPEGYYLPAGGSEPAQCPHGYYCPGVNGVGYNENTNQGLASCSVETGGLYTLSEPGATVASGCFRQCTTSDVFGGHVAVVSGNVYYGGNQTCAVTGCENGYHVNSGVCDANEIAINWENASAEAISANNAGSCTYGGDIRTPQSAETIPGKIFRGWRFEQYTIPTQYVVHFDCNDGSTPGAHIGYGAGATIHTSNPSERCTGIAGTRLGWECDHGIGTVEPGGTFTLPASNVTCIAQRPAQLYAVSFNCDANNIVEFHLYAAGDTVTTLDTDTCNIPVGYQAAAWTCETGTNHTTVSNNGGLFTMPEDTVTCTASWTAKVYSVIYDCNGGSGLPPVSSDVAYGETASLANNTCTAPTGYVFNRWNCLSSAEDPIIVNNGGFTMPAANVTCAALWTQQ